ncbi:hypothetical protein E4T44_11713 [Aureobasidium sp. EXF-8845]|nr:hypothetical protein E4T45_11597 [Aureobasidium sp. EXF-8846]KAI4800688.1 hypothetical protein E4T44_11713 [Aureobasidium sp. EXF-8845]
MLSESHNQTAFGRRAVERVRQIDHHLTSRPVHVREDMAASRTPSTTDTPSILHRQNGLLTSLAPTQTQYSASMTGSLPPFKCLLEVADQSQQLHYMRAPSVGSEYVSVPLIGGESTLFSPPESVASPTPTPSRSVSPAMAKMALPISQGRRQSPAYRVEKSSKSTKSKNYSTAAKAQELENNRRIDAAQRPYKDGVRVLGSGHTTTFPRFDPMHIPYEAKRTKSVTGSSDPNTRHNMAQTHLRAEKGSQRMTLQRLLVGALGWRGEKLQTIVNARSSGTLYEEKESLKASTNLIAIAIIFMQKFFDEEGMQQLVAMLDLFEPEDVCPAEVVRDARDDEKLYKFKCDAARIGVLEEAHLPLGLKNIRSREELLDIVAQKLIPIANDFGKSALQEMFLRQPTREGRAML